MQIQSKFIEGIRGIAQHHKGIIKKPTASDKKEPKYKIKRRESKRELKVPGHSSEEEEEKKQEQLTVKFNESVLNQLGTAKPMAMKLISMTEA